MLYAARYLPAMFTAALFALSAAALAEGGISLTGTRFVYPQGEKQLIIRAINSSKTDAFLVQSWVENADGKKTKDFIITPPLYVSKPQKGTSLRLVYAGREPPRDRETLYYLVTKSIPALEKEKTKDKNTLVIAMASRLKVFVRPVGLTPAASEAPSKLTFHRAGKQLKVSNPTPYHVTMTEISAGSQKQQNVMVGPKADITMDIAPAGSVTFRTIDDYGAFSSPQTGEVR